MRVAISDDFVFSSAVEDFAGLRPDSRGRCEEQYTLRYGTRKIFFEYGSFTLSPDLYPVTSTYPPFGSNGLNTYPGFPGTGLAVGIWEAGWLVVTRGLAEGEGLVVTVSILESRPGGFDVERGRLWEMVLFSVVEGAVFITRPGATTSESAVVVVVVVAVVVSDSSTWRRM